VWARMVCKHAWELSAVTRPAMPAEHRRPEPYAMAPKTLYPVRVPLGCARGRRATSCPRGAHRAPLGTAGLLLTQDQALTTRGGVQHLWPCLCQPGLAAGHVKMIRHHARFLHRKPHVVPQRTPIMAVGEHAARAPAQDPEEDRVPTGRLTTDHRRAGCNTLGQSFPVLGGQCGRPSTAMAIDHAVRPMQQEVLAPPRDARRAEPPARTQDLQRHGVDEQVEPHGGPPHQPHIIALLGVLQTTVQIFDGGATALYPDAHGCILLSGCLASVL
jgi:hypothetical protein